MVAEDRLNRQRLDLVVLLGAGAVRGDVVDLFRLDAGVVECTLHCRDRPATFLMHVGDAEGIGRRAIAQDLSPDSRPAPPGVLILLED